MIFVSVCANYTSTQLNTMISNRLQIKWYIEITEHDICIVPTDT